MNASGLNFLPGVADTTPCLIALKLCREFACCYCEHWTLSTGARTSTLLLVSCWTTWHSFFLASLGRTTRASYGLEVFSLARLATSVLSTQRGWWAQTCSSISVSTRHAGAHCCQTTAESVDRRREGTRPLTEGTTAPARTPHAK